MNDYKYTLDNSSKKFICIGCGKKRFVKYIDNETREYLPEQYGRCDREINCAYHLNPYEDGFHKNETGNKIMRPKISFKTKPISFIPYEVFKKSRNGYEKNYFIKYLQTLFDVDTINELISRYHIGTSKHWKGAVVFPQIDINGKIRQIKIMDYDPETGKRKKGKDESWKLNPKTGQYELDINNGDKIYFAGKEIINNWDANFVQCFLGEHLLRENKNPVAIFESEKTALISSVYFPQLICLACGSLTNLTAEKCKVLRGRNVILFPDLNGFEKWSNKAKELSQLFPTARFIVSDLLENNATESAKQQGLDLSDYLIQFDYKAFQQQEQQKQQQKIFEQSQPKEIAEVQDLQSVKVMNFSDTIKKEKEPEIPKPENWEQEITELERYFETTTLPSVPLNLNRWSIITNVQGFIDSHLAVVKNYNGNKTFLPYLERLQELKQYLTINLN